MKRIEILIHDIPFVIEYVVTKLSEGLRGSFELRSIKHLDVEFIDFFNKMNMEEDIDTLIITELKNIEDGNY